MHIPILELEVSQKKRKKKMGGMQIIVLSGIKYYMHHSIQSLCYCGAR